MMIQPCPLYTTISQREGMEVEGSNCEKGGAAIPCLWSSPVVAFAGGGCPALTTERGRTSNNCTLSPSPKWTTATEEGKGNYDGNDDVSQCMPFQAEGHAVTTMDGRSMTEEEEAITTLTGLHHGNGRPQTKITINIWWGNKVEASASSMLGAGVTRLRGSRVAMIRYWCLCTSFLTSFV